MSIQAETKKNGRVRFRCIPQKVAVTVKYLAPTNHRGSRVALSIPRSQTLGGKQRTKIISYDHAFDSCMELAANHIYDLTGISPVACATVTNPDHAETLIYDWFAPDDMRDQNQWLQINEALFPNSSE